MPEVHFQIRWPDGCEETCYSPSLVVKDYFEPGQRYPLAEFMARSRAALHQASDRVQAKYGFPCQLALGQLQRLETRSAEVATQPQPMVQFLGFLESP